MLSQLFGARKLLVDMYSEGFVLVLYISLSHVYKFCRGACEDAVRGCRGVAFYYRANCGDGAQKFSLNTTDLSVQPMSIVVLINI